MSKPTNDEHALLIFLKLSDDTFGTPEDREAVFDLEEHIALAVRDARAGEYDGHEFGHGWGVLYAYGPDARRLGEIATPLLQQFRPRKGSYFVQRYGTSGAPEERVMI